jgi:DNA-binding IclR family transcriptional regulator
VSSLETALKMVALLGKDRPVLRVGEVCRELGVPKSSVSRLLKTLSEYDIVEREPQGNGYLAGRRAMVLSELYVQRHSLHVLVDEALQRLTEDFQFACYAAVLTGPDIIIIRAHHGNYPLRMVQDLGVPIPAFRTSVGRALLARKSDEEVIALVQEREPEPIDRPAVLGQIESVRRCGAVTTDSTVIPGIAALGVAVRDAERKEMLGFSISYPTIAVDDAMRARMHVRIREEARTIAERIGDSYWVELAAV